MNNRNSEFLVHIFVYNSPRVSFLCILQFFADRYTNHQGAKPTSVHT